MSHRQKYGYSAQMPFAEEDNLSFYKGFHKELGINVLICEYKLLDDFTDPKNGKQSDDVPQQQSVLNQEILILQTALKKMMKINHRNISKIYDVLRTDKNLIVVEEDCTKGTLISMLKAEKFIEEKLAIFITKQIAQGLRQLHRNGIAHNYINLDNIELDSNGNWKISMRSLILKQFYLSPQFKLKGIRGKEGDVFSLGTAFYKMMFGVFAYSGKTKEQILLNVKNGQRRTQTILDSKLPFKIAVTKNIENIAFKMMQYKPEARPDLDLIISELTQNLRDDVLKNRKLPPQFDNEYIVFGGNNLSMMGYTNEQLVTGVEKSTNQLRKMKIISFNPDDTREFEEYKSKISKFIALAQNDLIQIKDILYSRTSAVLVYEYFNQGTLEDYFRKTKQYGKRQPPINQEKVEEVVSSICKTLSNLPEAHTWVTSSRIFLKNGKIKLSEPAFETDEVRRRLFNSKQEIDELAPQKKKSKNTVPTDSGMDTWSVGVLYYKLLYGSEPDFDVSGALIFPGNRNINQDQMQRLIYFLCKNPKQRKSFKDLDPSKPLPTVLSMSEVRIPSSLAAQSKIRHKKSRKYTDNSISDNSKSQLRIDHYRHEKQISLQNIDQMKKELAIEMQHGKQQKISEKDQSEDDDCFERNCLYIAGCINLKHLTEARFFQTLTDSWTRKVRYFLKILFSFVMYIPLFYMAFFSICGNLLVYRDFYQSTMVTTRRNPNDYYPTVNYTVVTRNTTYFKSYYNCTLSTLKYDMSCARDNYYQYSNPKDQVYVNQYIKSSGFVAFEIIGFIIVMLNLLMKALQVTRLDLSRVMHSGEKHEQTKYSKVLSYIYTKFGLASLFSIHYLLYGSLYHMGLEPCLKKPLLPSVDRLFNGWAGSFILLYIWQYIGILIAYGWIIYFTCFMKNKHIPNYVWVILLLLYIAGIGTRGMGGFVNSHSSYDTLVSLFGVFGELLEILTMLVCACIDAIFWRCIRKKRKQNNMVKSRVQLMEESHATIEDTENNSAL